VQYSSYLVQGPVQQCAETAMRAGRPVRAMLRIKSDPWMLDGDGAL